MTETKIREGNWEFPLCTISDGDTVCTSDPRIIIIIRQFDTDAITDVSIITLRNDSQTTQTSVTIPYWVFEYQSGTYSLYSIFELF